MAGRKRVYAMPVSKSNRPFKKRRFNKKRKGRKTTSFTSQAGSANSFGFRTKRISGRAYRSRLWNDSLMKTHYRSNNSVGTTLTAPLSGAQVSVTLFSAMASTASPFWTVAGGAQSADTAIPVPTFSSDIILRGGQIGLRISNNVVDATPMEVNIFLLYSNNNPTLPALANQPMGWEPSQVADFKLSFGRIVMRKKVLLENANVVEVNHRLRVQKIDQSDWANNSRRFYWMVTTASTETLLVAASASCFSYWNCSFSADAT